MTSIRSINGIGDDRGRQLGQLGIRTVADLVRKGASPRDRRRIAELTGLDQNTILTWVKTADLLRIDGIGENVVELLRASGVDTIADLKRRDPAELHRKMEEINRARSLAGHVPGEEEVARWVEQAKGRDSFVMFEERKTRQDWRWRS